MNNIYILMWLLALTVACVVIELTIRRSYPLKDIGESSTLDPDSVKNSAYDDYNKNQLMLRIKQRFIIFGCFGILLVMVLVDWF
ncbi:hypothetical protein [Aliivibrio fischeri]|uniref:hypothetical protein n=1 Tax=Aliivibrio fischeri TaxID=668 RepID=UPI0007C46D54|nr:hypothetical protein [Aliivibrio fischeri]